MRRMFSVLLFMGLVSFPLTNARAQPGGGQGGGAGGGLGGGGGAGGGFNQPGGISIDPNGVVSNLEFKVPSAKLAKKARQALAEKHLSDEMNRFCAMRCISLVRLEEAIAAAIDKGEDPSPELAYLAGLLRIDFVFVSEENNDLIIAGPAEGFAPNSAGRVLGIQSARPTLQLDDLIVALRTVPQGSQFGCSIDPVPGRLKQTQDWIARNSTAATAGVVAKRYEKMAEILGLQDVTVWGLPENSHMANVFVEADLRMKRVVMGLENPKVRKFKSHLAMLKPGANSLRRWWFMPFYDKFEVNEEKTAWAFAGQRCQLLSQEEYTNARGQRFDSPHKLKSAEKFAQQFTEKFPELCKNIAVFAELQNCFDLTLLAAIVQQHQLAERIGWKMELLRDAERLPAKKFTPAKQVPTLANIKRSGSRLVLGVIGGGVMITPRRTLAGIETSGGRFVAKVSADAMSARTKNWWWDIVPAAKDEPKNENAAAESKTAENRK